MTCRRRAAGPAAVRALPRAEALKLEAQNSCCCSCSEALPLQVNQTPSPLQFKRCCRRRIDGGYGSGKQPCCCCCCRVVNMRPRFSSAVGGKAGTNRASGNGGDRLLPLHVACEMLRADPLPPSRLEEQGSAAALTWSAVKCRCRRRIDGGGGVCQLLVPGSQAGFCIS